MASKMTSKQVTDLYDRMDDDNHKLFARPIKPRKQPRKIKKQNKSKTLKPK